MSPRKLLVADDSLTIQKVIRLALGQNSQTSGDGFDIQAVSDGKDAVQQIALQRPEVVLIDVSLPNKNAFEVKREINQLEGARDIRFILLSSAYETVDQDLYAATGFNGHLTKPFDPAHLRNVLSQTLAELDALKNAETRIIQVPLHSSPLDGPSIAPPPIEKGPPAPVSASESLSIDDLWSPEEHLPDLPPSHLSSANDTSAGFVLEPPSLPPLSSFQETIHETMPELPVFGSRSGPKNEREELKLLVENTLGEANTLDELGWSMQEPKAKPAASPRRAPPPLPPTPREPTLPPPSGLYDHGGRRFSLDPPKESVFEIEKPAQEPKPTPEILPLTPSQMEEIIERQLKAAIEKMAHQLLPDLAEKILKDEIHRMLSEPVNGS